MNGAPPLELQIADQKMSQGLKSGGIVEALEFSVANSLNVLHMCKYQTASVSIW